MKIEPVGDEFLYADGQTDMTMLSQILQLYERVKELIGLYIHITSHLHLQTGRAWTQKTWLIIIFCSIFMYIEISTDSLCTKK